MKLKRFNNINEEIKKPGISDEDDKFWMDAKAYGEKVDKYIPMNSDPEVRKHVKEMTKMFKWEPDETIALIYGMLVEINEHDMAKDFVELAKKYHDK